ncbi:MAG: diversity-generating retroelement protein Avd [Candidatus Shapirobacteria bacterium]|nr:diversity-generating retroelement protein Avd [Candidatus Shapirobacteria bacterium]
MTDFHSDSEFGKLNLDIPVFQKTYDLYKSFYSLVLDFPKKDRFTIGQRIENTILDILENIIAASQLSKLEKVPTLQKASIKLDVLKILIRCCKDLKIMDNKKYLTFESQVIEIGKMLGGWIKASSFNS